MPGTVKSTRKRAAPTKPSTKRNKTGTTLVKRGASKVFVPRTQVYLGNGMPDVLRVTLRCYARDILTAAAGVMDHTIIRANDLYAPINSLATTQPQYFDELMAIYTSFVVIKSTVTSRVYNISAAGGNVSCRAVLWENDNAAVTPTMDGLMVQPGSASATVLYGNTQPTTLTTTYSAASTKGKDLMANADAQGSASASPASVDYFYLSADGSVGATWTLTNEVIVEYDTLIFNRRDIGLSS